MADSDQDMQLVTDTLEGSLSDLGLDVHQLRLLMEKILRLLRQQGVPVDRTGTIGLTTHIGNFVYRSKQSVEVDYPSGFESQIPEEDLLIAEDVSGMVLDIIGVKPPRPETVLIGSHIAAMRLRASGQ